MGLVSQAVHDGGRHVLGFVLSLSLSHTLSLSLLWLMENGLFGVKVSHVPSHYKRDRNKTKLLDSLKNVGSFVSFGVDHLLFLPTLFLIIERMTQKQVLIDQTYKKHKFICVRQKKREGKYIVI